MSQPTSQKGPPLPWKKRVKIAAASAAGKLMMRLLGSTMRLRAHKYEYSAFLRKDGGSVLWALWHGDHFPVFWAYRHQGVYVVTSRSADGQILTNVLNSLGYPCVRGSSTRGGTRALIDLARVVKAGHDAAVAVDGPKGPRRVVKPGIILLGKLTGRPIVPICGALNRYWEFRSWDKYRMPKPFTKALTVGTLPIYVPPDADDRVIEEKRLELERKMLDIQAIAEREVGGNWIPGPPDSPSINPSQR